MRNQEMLEVFAFALSRQELMDQYSILWSIFQYWIDGTEPGDNTDEYEWLQWVKPIIDEERKDER